MEEEGFIKSIKDGNPHDFELLVKKYQSAVFRLAMGMVHNKEDAEEITQDVFISVYRSLKHFDHRSGFSTWLYRISINTSINFLRKKKRRGFWVSLSSILNHPAGVADNSAGAEDKEKEKRLADLINKLPDRQRVAFVLSKYEDLSQKQVAQVMRLTEGAVEQLLIRAKQNLRKKIQITGMDA